MELRGNSVFEFPSGLDSNFSPATTYQLHSLDLRPIREAVRRGVTRIESSEKSIGRQKNST